MKYLYILIVLGSMLFAKTPPLSFLALEEGGWHVVVCDDAGNYHTLQTQQEPRTYDYDFATGNLVYIASDKNVHIIIDNNESILLKSTKNAYTEPSFVNNGKQIMLVELINGNSKKTKIITIDLVHKKIKTLHSQYSTALEPYMNNGVDLYYANVSCVDGCGKIIQEIWHKNLITEEAKQLTLLNTLSHQPHANRNNTQIYFSSYNNHNYHIWGYDCATKMSKALTSGNVIDSFPSPYEGGILFIRRIGKSITLNSLDKNSTIHQVSLPKAYKKIRNLKVKL